MKNALGAIITATFIPIAIGLCITNLYFFLGIMFSFIALWLAQLVSNGLGKYIHVSNLKRVIPVYILIFAAICVMLYQCSLYAPEFHLYQMEKGDILSTLSGYLTSFVVTIFIAFVYRLKEIIDEARETLAKV